MSIAPTIKTSREEQWEPIYKVDASWTDGKVKWKGLQTEAKGPRLASITARLLDSKLSLTPPSYSSSSSSSFQIQVSSSSTRTHHAILFFLSPQLHADWDPLRLRPTRLRAEQRLTLVVPAPRPDRFSLRGLLAPPGGEEEEEERRGAGGKKRKGAAGGSRPFPASLGGCPLAATSAVRTAVPRWLLAESTLEFGHPPTNSVALVPAITSDWGHNAPSWQAQDIVGLVTHLLPTSGPRSAAAPLPLERGGAPWARWSAAAAAAAAAEEEQGFLALGRRVSGASGLKAWLSTEVTNSAECDIGILYTDLMPHFIVPYFHTLTFQVFQNNSFTPFEPEQFTPKPASFPHLSILELNMTIPKHSTVIISMEVKKKLLDAFSFPPDASRGLDLHPGIAKVFGISNCEKSVDEGTTSSSNIAGGGGDSIVPLLKLINIVEAEKLEEESSNLISSAVRKYFGSRPPEVSLYSQSSLTYLPEPDFSMPFNVITINCTVIALFIGTMMNLLVRKSDVVAPNSKKKTGPRSKIRHVVDKIKSKFRFLQRKKNKKEHQS